MCASKRRVAASASPHCTTRAGNDVNGARRSCALYPFSVDEKLGVDPRFLIRGLNFVHELYSHRDLDAGVKQGDRVILNPPVNLVEGSKVQLAAH
jgi:hypothetical protein